MFSERGGGGGGGVSEETNSGMETVKIHIKTTEWEKTLIDIITVLTAPLVQQAGWFLLPQ